MRSLFQEQLSRIEEQVAVSIELAIATLQDVAGAVSEEGGPVPPSIERSAQRLRDAQRELTERIVATMACQAPVAGDLRLMLVLLECAHHTSLLANQFDLINGQVMEIDPIAPDCLGTARTLVRMAQLASSELESAAHALRERDISLARRVGRDDASLNQLNRDVFATVLKTRSDSRVREVGMRHVLIARSLERIGDNAVDIAERAVFLSTGEVCEFSDASRPRADTAA